MESSSKVASAAKFTVLSHLRAISDTKENIIVYKSPFELFKVIPQAHQGLTTVLKLFMKVETNQHYLLSASFDKQIKLWDLSPETPELLGSVKHPKKIDLGFLDLEGERLVFTDKTGDIFETYFKDLKLTPPEMIQAHMDTLTLFDRYKFSDGKEVVILADEYEKIKFVKYPEIYHILNIFSPYSKSNFLKVLDLTPNALVTLLSTGEVDLINLESLEKNEYIAKRVDIKDKIEGKQIYDICKVDSEYFIAVDNYFTVIVVIQIKECQVIQEKVMDITNLKILKEEKDYNKKRFIEAERNSDEIALFIKYERSPEDQSAEDQEKDESKVKLYEGVYFKKLSIKL